MKRILMVVAYDGTNYHGWQIQQNAVSIEEIINKKLSELLNEHIEVVGASRTDAGVHAEGNVAVFDSETSIPPDKIANALNSSLPDDIVIQESFEVEPDFHPRKCDSEKTYEYRILNRKFDLPVKSRNSIHVYKDMNIDAMREAAAYFVGQHDFKNFCSSHTQAKTTIRIIYSFEIERDKETITLRVTGNGFLYNMVRMLVGTLINVGCGKVKSNQIPALLAAKERPQVITTAPAKGLTLIGIDFY